VKKEKSLNSFDCVIIGGGMVGAASALTLAQLGLHVAVVEQAIPKSFSKEQPFDLRVSAISLASQHLLEQLNAWSQITQWRSCAYKRLGVWEQESSYTEFNAQEIEQAHLGHIIENRLIQLSLWQQMEAHEHITLYCPETLTNLEQFDDYVELTLKNKIISAKFVIGADGANSKVRSMVNIGLTGWNYQQSAMLINVETEISQQDITWQQFFPTGPVAFLPLSGISDFGQNGQGSYASLVWYHKQDEIKRLAALSNTQLEKEISQSFPKRLGQIKVIDKAAFPLTRRHANTYQNKRVILLGDAAHTINPMAGQGVNLGFKDVKALQSIIASAIANGECWHNVEVLAQYEKTRRKDNLLMMTTMDALYSTFSHPSPIIKMIRNSGFSLINHVPFINSVVKSKALAYACGV